MQLRTKAKAKPQANAQEEEIIVKFLACFCIEKQPSPSINPNNH